MTGHLLFERICIVYRYVCTISNIIVIDKKQQIFYMTKGSNFLTIRTIIHYLHKLLPGLYLGFIRCVGKCHSSCKVVLLQKNISFIIFLMFEF